MTRQMNVTILGSGSWGTTLGSVSCHNTPTTIWARRPEIAEEIRTQHTNTQYLGDNQLPSKLDATADLAAACAQADVLVVGVPSQSIRQVLTDAEPHLRPWVPVLSLVKGLEQSTKLRPTQVIDEILPGHPIGLLAGPNIASEIIQGKAAAATIAMPDLRIASSLQPLFARNRFRVYTNTDVLGSELGGVLKNIIAIAAGMADGLGVGVNTAAMVISRGLAEITRLGEALGADPLTFSGLTGLGDLIATCMSPASRNRRVGEQLGEGRTIEEAVEILGQVAEGVKTVRSVVDLAREHDVEVPICAEVDAVVNEGRTPIEAYRGLVRIQPGMEHEAG
ncbi:NAD(P)H-dependent glycerol-3-phosphate dehydrogenase [Euzebya tangerina]|uniref:NAD(P)H-dependent glycerol-3-phosphate dehydrogenase n=1 Tax=Euzebya tangerina TaxID=591198 RepID=UPI000E322D6D|nr:NAD(P)H-dependent glycerol-3-phosphate dehydrogenase [Euzebya tangerina]